jgi:hypothetical protein
MSGATTDTVKLREAAELNKLTVAQLKQFLKARSVRTTGKKEDLLKLARLYFDTPVLQANDSDKTESDIFANTSLVWQPVNSSSKIAIPSSFSIDVVTSYLSTLPAMLVSCKPGESGDEVEEANAGTEKPSVKGRRMYANEKLTMVEVAAGAGGQLLFRGNCEASLRKSCRYPAVALGQDGRVLKGNCNCPAAAGKPNELIFVVHQLITLIPLRRSLLPCGGIAVLRRRYFSKTPSRPRSRLHQSASSLGARKPPPTFTRSHLQEQVNY